MKLNVKEYVDKELSALEKRVCVLKINHGISPRLNIIRNGSDVATESYLKNKIKIGTSLGIDVNVVRVENKDDLLLSLQNDVIKSHSPVILQLPVEKPELEKYYEQTITNDNTDVDGFFSYEAIYKGFVDGIIPATPKGIIKFMEHWAHVKDKDVGKLKVTVIGRGKLVGKPLVSLLANKVGCLYLATSKTPLQSKQIMIKDADVVMLCTGDKNSLNGIDDFGKDKLIIDSGIFRENGKLRGELTPHINKLDDSVDYTPVPSGVGILTTLELFENVITLYEDNIAMKNECI